MLDNQTYEMFVTHPSPVVVITGEGDQGQIIAAMSIVEAALRNGQDVLHNGCSNVGLRLTEEAVSSDERLAEIMDIVANGSVFVLADADCIPAIVSEPTQSEPQWLTTCKAKQHMAVLTTVRGREYRLGVAIADAEASHVQVEAAPHLLGMFVTWASGHLRERLPVARAFVRHEIVLRWAALTDGSYQAPSRPDGELIVVPPRSPLIVSDYSEAVRSTETASPKHPAHSFLLTRIIKHDENNQVKYTETIGFPWQESVNKHRDEDIATRYIELACEKWGMPVSHVELNPNPSGPYPDAQARTTNGPVNIEITKVQPRWPSEATLSALADGTRAGKAPDPTKNPVIQCRECGILDVNDVLDIHHIPEHDENHTWTCVYPRYMIGPDWPDNLTVLPELKIDIDHVKTAITERLERKISRAQRFGSGTPNWLMLVIEGFPPVEGFDSLLRDFDWEGMDGVFAIVANEFASAIHGHCPDDMVSVLVLKCPEQDCHTCYHPGFVLLARKGDSSMNDLRQQERDRGVTHLVTSHDGTILAELEAEPQQPISEQDFQKAYRAATKVLPYDMPTQDIPILPNELRDLFG